MASTSDQAAWKAQADFMRESGALHAEWAWIRFEDVNTLVLTKLVLGPPPARTPSASPAPESPAKKLQRMHDTMFAASRVKPPFHAPIADADEPRAVRAKKAAAARGTSKNPKRSSR